MNMNSENPYQTPESDVSPNLPAVDIVSLRKQLVPLWIKVFGWFFIVLGVVTPLAYLVSMMSGKSASFSLFGLEASGGELTLTGVFLIALFVALGISAYGLIFGRDWGLKACLATGYLGLLVTVAVSVSGFSAGNFVIRLEPFIQIPYLIKLHRIKAAWNGSTATENVRSPVKDTA